MKHLYYLRGLLLGFLICVLVISLCACAANPPFKQPIESIEKIELIEHSATEESVLCTLTDTDVELFMEDLLDMPCYKRSSPVGELGQLEIRIYYIDGNADFIGSEANACIQDGNMVIHGWYYFEEAALRELFAAYSE